MNNNNKYNFLNKNYTSTKKISIVMAYYNRQNEIIQTLDQFKYLYYNKYNFEVIIVDDYSNNNNNLDFIINNYNFKIKLIKINKKNWINPVIPYNLGFSFVEGEIIILQNPEIFHCDDIIKFCIDNINNNYYYTFPVFSSPDYDNNKKIKELHNTCCNNYNDEFINKIDYEEYDFDYNYYINNYKDLEELNYDDAYNHWLNYGIKENRYCNNKKMYYPENIIYEWKGWYNHNLYNKRDLHFLTAFNKDLLDKIGGFCNDFKDGLWYDDDDFKNRISKITEIKTVESNKYIGIHLYHSRGSKDQELDKNFIELRNKNKIIYDYNDKNNIIYCDIKNNLKYNIDYFVINNM